MKVTFGIIFSAVLVGAVFSSTPRDDSYPSQGSYYGSNYNDGYRGPHRGGGYGSSYGSHHQGGSYQQGRPYGYGYKKVLCPKLDAPENGKVKVSGLYPGDGATYSCNDGYVLVGLSKRKCLRDGKWSQKAPICKRINCGPLPHIANGAVDVSPDTRLNSVATYSCDPGYNLQGSSTRTCQANGKWSGSEPSCSPVDCGDLDDPDKGWVHISPDTLLGSVAIYRCKLGYELSSGDRRYCQTDGTWSNDAPTCEPISCGPVPEPKDNSKIASSDGTSLRDQTTYACNDGYVLEGTATIYCQNDKTYSDDSPKCNRIDCGDLSDIPNGAIDISPDTRLNSVATYSCDPGYNLQGDSTRTCQANGEWSGSEPSCSPVNCGDLDDPDKGWVHISPDTLLGSVAIYRCKLGYELSSGDRRYCQTDGTWSNDAPTCEPISCGPVPEPKDNGRIDNSDGTSLRDQTTYACNDGYILEGTATIYCQNDKTYSDDSPKCIPVDCGEPDPTDPNGSLDVSTTTLGSVASYSCNSGFKLEGSAQATCQANGEWSSDAPTCTPIDCGSLSAPENGAVYFYPGTTFTSTASFVCRRGFRLVGSETRTCQADGSWSGVQPVCKKIKCPKLKAPQYGKLYVSGNHPGDYAVYDCGYGYKLVGKRRRTCGYNGKWSGSDADCVKDSHYGGGGYGHYGGHDY